MKKLSISICMMSCLIFTLRVLLSILVPVTIVRIPYEVKFTDTYKSDAYLSLPAAYTSVNGTIEGAY